MKNATDITVFDNIKGVVQETRTELNKVYHIVFYMFLEKTEEDKVAKDLILEHLADVRDTLKEIPYLIEQEEQK